MIVLLYNRNRQPERTDIGSPHARFGHDERVTVTPGVSSITTSDPQYWHLTGYSFVLTGADVVI